MTSWTRCALRSRALLRARARTVEGGCVPPMSPAPTSSSPGRPPPHSSPCMQLYFCEFCLKFFKRKSELVHHASKCLLKHPPGDEIYRGVDGISMWEVDGTKEKQYCQSLSYVAKMFLDHKTLFYDVDVFFFYIMTKVDAHGYRIVGYFR